VRASAGLEKGAKGWAYLWQRPRHLRSARATALGKLVLYQLSYHRLSPVSGVLLTRTLAARRFG
jgi:hypothetical protein